MSMHQGNTLDIKVPYPGEYIVTLLVVRPLNDRIYITAKDHRAYTNKDTYVIRDCEPLTRPEVCRKYKSVPISPYGKTAKAFHEMCATRLPKHYRLEEIHD